MSEEVMEKKSGAFWQDKLPCWKIKGCPDAACRECAAYRNQDRPCWELDTLCRRLLGSRACRECEVYKLYGGARQLGP